MTHSHKPRMSTGELISSLAFAGVGFWLVEEAASHSGLRAVGIGLCAAACIAAALRFLIAKAWDKYIR